MQLRTQPGLCASMQSVTHKTVSTLAKYNQDCALTLLHIVRQQRGTSSSGWFATHCHRQGTMHCLADKHTGLDISNEEADHALHTTAKQAQLTLHTLIVLRVAIHFEFPRLPPSNSVLMDSHPTSGTRQIARSCKSESRHRICAAHAHTSCPCLTQSFFPSDCTSRRPTKPDSAQKNWAARWRGCLAQTRPPLAGAP